MRKFIVCLVAFFCFQIAKAQEIKIKFGKIAPEDLAMQSYALDTEANAVYLAKVGSVRYDLNDERYFILEENHVVLKILTETGIDEYGNVEIPYYRYDDHSKITGLKAIVHLPDGTEIKVDNSQIIDEKTNDFWSAKKIAFPKLVPGAIIEYQYNLQSQSILHPVDWFLQADIPIRHAELQTYFPEWFEFVILSEGSAIDNHTTSTQNEQVTTSSTSRGIVYSVKSKEVQGTTYQTETILFLKNLFINKDVPALEEECCITTMEDYYARVRFQLKAYQFPLQSREPVMNSWKKLAEELYEIPEWGGQFRNKRPGELILEAAGITVIDSSSEKKTATRIYDYINQNIQWNEHYGIGHRKDNNTILKAKSGDSGDLNKLMCAALIQAGIDAKPVLISTRDHGKPLHLYPFVDQFNHMVIIANPDGKDHWIDLGNKLRPLGLLRANSLNGKGWLVDQQDPIWIDVPVMDSKTIYLIKGNLDANGIFNGTVETRFTGYHAVSYRQQAKDDKEKLNAELIMNGPLPISIISAEFVNLEDPTQPLQYKGTITNESIATAAANKLYLNPILPKGLDELPFKLIDRTYPIEMNYPSDISMIMNLTLPEGFAAESMPEPIRFVTENNGIQVTYDASVTAGKLNVTLKYIVKQLNFDPAEYPVLKGIYDQRKQKFNEQIVLAKT